MPSVTFVPSAHQCVSYLAHILLYSFLHPHISPLFSPLAAGSPPDDSIPDINIPSALPTPRQSPGLWFSAR